MARCMGDHQGQRRCGGGQGGGHSAGPEDRYFTIFRQRYEVALEMRDVAQEDVHFKLPHALSEAAAQSG